MQFGGIAGGRLHPLSSRRTRTIRVSLPEIRVACVQLPSYEECASLVPLASQRAARGGRRKMFERRFANAPDLRLSKERALRRYVSIVGPNLIVSRGAVPSESHLGGFPGFQSAHVTS